MTPLNDATTRLLFACLDRVESGNFKQHNVYESTSLLFRRECAGSEQRRPFTLRGVDLVYGMGILDKISTSGFSCRRPFQCTRAIRLSLTPSLFHVRSCMTSTRALGMSFASAIEIFLHPTCFLLASLAFRTLQIWPSSDLAFVAPP